MLSNNIKSNNIKIKVDFRAKTMRPGIKRSFYNNKRTNLSGICNNPKHLSS